MQSDSDCAGVDAERLATFFRRHVEPLIEHEGVAVDGLKSTDRDEQIRANDRAGHRIGLNDFGPLAEQQSTAPSALRSVPCHSEQISIRRLHRADGRPPFEDPHEGILSDVLGVTSVR